MFASCPSCLACIRSATINNIILPLVPLVVTETAASHNLQHACVLEWSNCRVRGEEALLALQVLVLDQEVVPKLLGSIDSWLLCVSYFLRSGQEWGVESGRWLVSLPDSSPRSLSGRELGADASLIDSVHS
jgi:hypothetical protein